MSLIFTGLAGTTLARQQPNPPPSGIVVHLFGPGSLTSNILPGAPGQPPRATGPTSAAPGAPATDTNYQEPTMHDIMHQMFVVGDPNMKPGSNLAKGRASDRP